MEKKPVPKKGARPDKTTEAEHIRELAYAHAVAALAAQVSIIDAPVSAEERKAFKRLFPLHLPKYTSISALFDEAIEDETPAEHYCARLKAYFRKDKDRLEQLVDHLFEIALCDGMAKPEEMELLSFIAIELGLNARQTLAKLHVAIIGDNSSPHAVLGLMPNAKQEAVRKAYRYASALAHPDRVRVDNAMVRELYTHRFTQVQNAYGKLTKGKKTK